ncbi:MAG: peptide chain release factor family protein [Thermodesulfobacteriota bacterium]
MNRFNVSPVKERALLKKMHELGISEDDIVATFVKSGGKGGQNVNKNSTCVNLKHIPSGITVKFQKERSQLLNRFFARRELVSKIEEIKLGKRSPKQQKADKIRKQKLKRRKRNLEKSKNE